MRDMSAYNFKECLLLRGAAEVAMAMAEMGTVKAFLWGRYSQRQIL